MLEICNRHVNKFLQIFNRNVSNMLQTCFRNFTDMLRTCYRHIRESNKLLCMHVCKMSLIRSSKSNIKKPRHMKFGNKFPIYIRGQLKIFEPHLPSQNRYEIRT